MKKKSARSFGPCEMECCENEAAFPRLGLCLSCYQAIRYWLRAAKTPKDILERKKKLQVFQNRMDHLMPNVVSIKRRRKA